jgi:hypothetical protein
MPADVVTRTAPTKSALVLNGHRAHNSNVARNVRRDCGHRGRRRTSGRARGHERRAVTHRVRRSPPESDKAESAEGASPPSPGAESRAATTAQGSPFPPACHTHATIVFRSHLGAEPRIRGLGSAPEAPDAQGVRDTVDDARPRPRQRNKGTKGTLKQTPGTGLCRY